MVFLVFLLTASLSDRIEHSNDIYIATVKGCMVFLVFYSQLV